MDLAWWIGVIGVPLVGANFGYIVMVQRQVWALERIVYQNQITNAVTYATVTFAKDIDLRLSESLRRIDDKLDRLLEGQRRRQAGE